MYQHLINNNIFTDEQFGFRTNSSTMAATFNLINEMIDAFNSKKVVGDIFWLLTVLTLKSYWQNWNFMVYT
jgi:hypothetical protein